jgi:NADP-dependent 3-hydroxy acid dehydrogenase YdfG
MACTLQQLRDSIAPNSSHIAEHGMEALADQVVIVTGASSGIGRACAVSLADAGAKVVLAARRTERLTTLAAELAGESLAVACDVSDEASVANLAEQTLHRFGRIDGLVNNAGVGAFAPLVETSLDTFQQIFDVNVTGTFLCSKAVLPGMLERGSGWIINVGSDVSRRAIANGAAYCASKFAQYALGLALNAECRPRGVRVGSVLPGMVETEFAGGIADERTSWILKPEDVAEAVLFMATRPTHAVIDDLTVHPVRQEY